MTVRLPLLAATLLLSFVQATQAQTPPCETPGVDWRTVATPADRDRLRDWRGAWERALPPARAADAAAVAAAGPLFAYDQALPNALPPAGNYRCRTFKLGAAAAATRDFTAYPWFDCRVEADGDLRRLARLNGSQRPVGTLYPDGAARGVFLGTLLLGDESSALRYGRDPLRDMAGQIERIGADRWRIAFPAPRFESLLDVIELVPAS